MIAFLFAGQINVSFAQTKTATNNVLDAYYQIKNALASDNAVLAAKKATVLEKQIKTVKIDKLPGAEKKAWTEQLERVKSATTSIANGTDIAEQRKSFGLLSTSMIGIAKNSKIGKDAIFVQYCPMAKEGWLNENKKIENPYYGKSMFECGTVKEVLNEK